MFLHTLKILKCTKKKFQPCTAFAFLYEALYANKSLVQIFSKASNMVPKNKDSEYHIWTSWYSVTVSWLFKYICFQLVQITDSQTNNLKPDTQIQGTPKVCYFSKNSVIGVSVADSVLTVKSLHYVKILQEKDFYLIEY